MNDESLPPSRRDISAHGVPARPSGGRSTSAAKAMLPRTTVARVSSKQIPSPMASNVAVQARLTSRRPSSARLSRSSERMVARSTAGSTGSVR